MKKLLVLLLALAMTFAFAGCGGTEEPAADEGITSIPLGGSLDPMDVSEYGTYTEIETPYEGEEGDTINTYYDENSDTPYIIVTRWANTEGVTLEEEVKALADAYGASTYQMSETDEYLNAPCGVYCIGTTINDDYYYGDLWVIEDGDDFVELAYYGATEELQIGDSNSYFWIPKGYGTYEGEEEDVAKGEFFSAAYPEKYWFPNIWMSKYDPSYESYSWYWSDDYPDGLPMDKATYDAYMKKVADNAWTDEDTQSFYKAMGYDTVYEVGSGYTDTEYWAATGSINGSWCTEGYVTIDDATYIYFLWSEGEPAPAYNKALLQSIHTK